MSAPAGNGPWGPDEPLISVCISSYNYADYLIRALEVLKDQKDDADFEVVISDDASTDDSVARAAQFAAETASADLSDARGRFLALLPSPFASILDFGCGSGRDTKAFLERGCRVTAADGSPELCVLASAYTGIPVRRMLFRELDETEAYDGIWACASLLHLTKRELYPVMRELGKALRPGGILYVSFKYGDFEGDRRGRYFTDFTPEGFRDYLKDLPEYRIAQLWVTGDVRPGRGEERWLNVILEKACLL